MKTTKNETTKMEYEIPEEVKELRVKTIRYWDSLGDKSFVLMKQSIDFLRKKL